MKSGIFAEKYNQDRSFGIAQEENTFEKLKTKFGEDLEKIPSRYSVFDFKNKGCYVELKSRRCKKDTYPTTMIGENKLKNASKRETDTFFAFNFEDGLFYWKYNKEDIDAGKVTFKEGGRFDRGRVEKSLYAYIDKEILQPI